MTRNIGTDPEKYDMVRHETFRDIVIRVTASLVDVITYDGDKMNGRSSYIRHQTPALCQWQHWCKSRDNK